MALEFFPTDNPRELLLDETAAGVPSRLARHLSSFESGFRMIKKYQVLNVSLVAPLGVVVLLLVHCFHPSVTSNNRESKPKLAASPQPATPTQPARVTDADFARHVEQLKKKLPSSEFSVVIQRPFVVIGDEPLAAVKEHSEQTVKWAVDKLKQDFFTQDPKEILDIWLFKDPASYEKNALALFGEKPTTPYGYYSSTHKALIMNIATGGGTLVHEIVHPFMEANFPACPPWLNEGLGSLYEQCGEVDGHIHGYTNWRLPGLQAAIKAGRLPSFQSLTSLDTNDFYNEDRGTNYGQSRYLCYYLQEHDLLIKFYREFHSHQKEDSTGYKSLQKILGERDMEVFKQKWEKYVLGLTRDVVLTPIPPPHRRVR